MRKIQTTRDQLAVAKATINWSIEMRLPESAVAPATASRRKRGGLLLDIILGLLLLVGLIYGAYSYFQQGSTSQELASMNSRFVALSSEVRAQYANAPAGYPTGAMTTAVQGASSIKASEFRNVTITGTGANTFTIAIANLSPVVCTRLSTSDLGPRSSGAACSGTGEARTLTVTYSG